MAKLYECSHNQLTESFGIIIGCEGRAAPTIRRENFGVKQHFCWGRRCLSHHAVIYMPTGLVVMALRNASGEAMVEMVCVRSPTP